MIRISIWIQDRIEGFLYHCEIGEISAAYDAATWRTQRKWHTAGQGICQEILELHKRGGLGTEVPQKLKHIVVYYKKN